MNEKMLIEEAKEILEQHGYNVVKENKYNFYPKETNKNVSMQEGLFEAEKEHKKVIEILKDK